VKRVMLRDFIISVIHLAPFSLRNTGRI